MKIHVLTENRAEKRGFLAEHGLSIFIEHSDVNILFDTGQSDVYCKNAKLMGVDLHKTDCIVLSHGHYDHCGGLIDFPHEDKMPKIYVHQDALQNKYAINSGKVPSYREVGIPWSPDDYPHIKDNLILNKKSIQVIPSVTLHGNIPNTIPFEGVPQGFFIGTKENLIPDMMQDEQMLVFERGNELVIFLGCSHPGIINCLTYALSLFPGKRIHTVMAGMHLGNATSARIQITIQHLHDLDIQQVIPLHCTGVLGICEMKRALGDRCLPLCAGQTIEF